MMSDLDVPGAELVDRQSDVAARTKNFIRTLAQELASA